MTVHGEKSSRWGTQHWVQVSPPSSNSPKYSHNEPTTTKAKEINFQDEIARLKQDIERLLQKDFCKQSEVQ